MGRGVRLACASCNYWADLFEQRATLDGVLAEDGESSQQEDAPSASYLCPQCVEPIALTADAVTSCPHCATPLLDFAAATQELADAARTRAAFDLRSETAGRERVAKMLAVLRASEPASVLDGRQVSALVIELMRHDLADGSAAAASVWLPLSHTAALDGLESALEAAPSVAACTTLLEARLADADRTIGSLAHLMDEEADLPGVPCPRCGTGELLHWPIWL